MGVSENQLLLSVTIFSNSFFFCSVGVICYVLLSGLSPFMGDTDIDTMTNVTLGKYNFDDDAFNIVSESAKEFIRHLLQKDGR